MLPTTNPTYVGIVKMPKIRQNKFKQCFDKIKYYQNIYYFCITLY